MDAEGQEILRAIRHVLGRAHPPGQIITRIVQFVLGRAVAPAGSLLRLCLHLQCREYIRLQEHQVRTDRISKSLVIQKLSGSQVKAKSVFFAIRVGYLPAEESLKYFDIGYYLITEDGQNITHTLDFCRKEQWQKLG